MSKHKKRPAAGGGAGENTEQKEHIARIQEVQHAVAQYAACVYKPGDIVEIRLLPSGESFWTTPEELTERAELLLGENARGQNIYAGANPRKKPGGRRSEDVALARSLFGDFDHVSAKQAQERWQAAGLPEPTLVINSGHGVHAYWRLVEPITDLALWTQMQKRLIAALDSDPKVHDAPRIMRLPGLMNIKADLPPAPTQIIAANPKQVFELSEVLQSLPEIPVDRACTQVADTPSGQRGGNLDALARAARYAQSWPGVPEGERNPDAIRHAMALTRDFGLSDAEAWPLMKVWNDRNQPPLPEAELKEVLLNGSKYGRNPIGCKLATKGGFVAMSPSPQDISDLAEVPDWVPCPVEVLPPILRDYVVQMARALGCDPAFVALPCLAALAACIGTTRAIRLMDTWREFPVIWAMVVARSGTLKSPALDAATTSIRELQDEEMQRYKEELVKYEQELEAYEQQQKQGGGKGKSGPEKPKKPFCTRFVFSDITIEALATLLEDNPRGGLLYKDELSGWVNGFDQYKGGRGSDASHWLQLHRAGSLYVDRKSGDKKTIYLRRAAVSVAGTIQPRIVVRAFSRDCFDSGLVARLLLVQPPEAPKSWPRKSPSRTAVAGLDLVVRKLLALRPEEDDEPIELSLTKEADERWGEFYERHDERRRGTIDDDFMAALAKLEATAARLALIFQLVEDHTSKVVGAEAMMRAIALTDWLVNEAARIYARLKMTPEVEKQFKLIDFIRRCGGRVTVRDVQQGGPRRLRATADTVRDALQELVDVGVGRWESPTPGSPGGRPSEVFQLADNSVATGDTATKPPTEAAAGDETPTDGHPDGVLSPSPPSPPSGGESSVATVQGEAGAQDDPQENPTTGECSDEDDDDELLICPRQ